MPALGCSPEDEEEEEWEPEDEEAIGRASLAMSMDAAARAQVLMLCINRRRSVPACEVQGCSGPLGSSSLLAWNMHCKRHPMLIYAAGPHKLTRAD